MSVSALVKCARQKLLKAEEQLNAEGKEAAAAILASERIRLESIIAVHLVDLADIKAPVLAPKNPLESELYKIWSSYYPQYGTPSARDFRAVKALFRDVINVVYRQANEVFLERIVANYNKSTANWIVQNSSLALFATHFRSFVKGPIHDQDWQAPLVENRNISRPIV